MSQNLAKGIPPYILRKSEELLLQSNYFDDNATLKSLFTDKRIAIWKNQLPQANNTPQQKVAITISFLHEKWNTKGENGFVLFLHVLRDKIPEGDSLLDELTELINKINGIDSKVLPSQTSKQTNEAEMLNTNIASPKEMKHSPSNTATSIGIGYGACDETPSTSPQSQKFNKHPKQILRGSDYFCIVYDEMLSFHCITDKKLFAQITPKQLSYENYKFNGAVITASNQIFLSLSYDVISPKSCFIGLEITKTAIQVNFPDIYSTDDHLLSEPIINNQMVYFIDYNYRGKNSQLIGYDIDHELITKKPIQLPDNHALQTTPIAFTVTNNMLYLAISDDSGNKSLYKLDISRPPRIVSLVYPKANSQIGLFSRLAIDGNYLIFATGYGCSSEVDVCSKPSRVHLIDLISDELKWSSKDDDIPLYQNQHRLIEARPLIMRDNQTVYVAGQNHYIHGFDIETGQKESLVFQPTLRQIQVSPIYLNNKIITLDKSGNWIETPIVIKQIKSPLQIQPAIPTNRSLMQLSKASFKLHIPPANKDFLNSEHVDLLVETMSELDDFQETNDRRSFLREANIPQDIRSKITLSGATRQVAKNIIYSLEHKGRWAENQKRHLLVNLLEKIIASVGWDTKVKLVELIFYYQLIEDVSEITKLSQRYAVPPPIPTFDVNNIELPTDDIKGLESLFDPASRNYIAVDFFERGRQAVQAVCRLEWTGQGKGRGTGFLVADDLILTNYHVINPDELPLEALPQRLKNCRIKFEIKDSPHNIELGVNLSQPIVNVSPKKALDYMLIRLERSVQDDNRKPLICSNFNSGKLPFANIIHYPAGQDMKIVFRNNHIKGIQEDRIHYSSDTENGSSGAPVLDDEWQVIALHHAGEKDREGNTIRLGNEGILLSAIHAENKDLWKIHHD